MRQRRLVPPIVPGRRGNAVLIAEEDWNAINETLYLLSVPEMRESVREGMQAGLAESRMDRVGKEGTLLYPAGT